MDRFIGVWRLILQTSESEGGTVSYPRGEGARGLLMYDVNGWMSVHLLRAEPRSDRHLSSLETALEDYLGYYGTYHVDEVQSLVVHHVVGCSYAEWIGTDQVRHYRFEDEKLILRAEAVREDRREQRVLVWERVDTAK